MIPIFLQDSMIDELNELFANFRSKNVKGEMVPLNIYPQSLPARKAQKDTAHYPFIVVKLLDGEDPDETSSNTCKLYFHCGIWDDNENMQGHRDCMNILQKLYEHLMRKRMFAGKFIIEYPIRWTLTEEDYYPYYYGGLETNWTIGKVTMPDDDLT